MYNYYLFLYIFYLLNMNPSIMFDIVFVLNNYEKHEFIKTTKTIYLNYPLAETQLYFLEFQMSHTPGKSSDPRKDVFVCLLR